MFAFFVAFPIFVVGQRRDFKFDTQIGHSYSQYADYKPSLKGAWLHLVTHFKFGAPFISQEWLKLELSNFVHWWVLSSLTKRIKKSPTIGGVTYLNYYDISGMAKARDFKYSTVVRQVAD